MRNDERIFTGLILRSLENLFGLNVFRLVSFNMRVESSFYKADLATGRERQLTTGKRAERTKHGFRCSFFSALPLVKPVVWFRAPSSTDVNVLLLNQPVNIAQRFCIGRVSYFHCLLRLMLKGVWTRWLLYWDKRLIDLTLSWKSSR